jgi:hypothetical protein
MRRMKRYEVDRRCDHHCPVTAKPVRRTLLYPSRHSLAILAALFFVFPAQTAAVFFISLAEAAAISPSITLSSTDQTIFLGDSVVIEVEVTGVNDTLDVSPLFKGADLLRETTGTRIAVIDQRVVEVKLRRMEFQPRQQGRLVFGPLTGSTTQGIVTSNTVIIDVQPPSDTHWQPDTQDLQLELTLSIDAVDGDHTRILPSASTPAVQPWIGQHLVADIILRHRHPIADETVALPTFAGFDVLAEFEQRRTIEHTELEQSWRVIAWRYHLFAQHSGTLSIDGIRWRGTIVRSRTQRADFERSTAPASLMVQPALGTDSWWLPATRVALTDSWSNDVRELAAGDEIIRTITLSASNVLASQLPDVVPLESRALHSTLIRQQRTQKLVDDTILATALFEFRMIAQSPIPVFLDTVRVPWYSTLEYIGKEAIIPARRIDVGLPDRADLLAEIALEENVFDRWLLALRGSWAQVIPLHLTLAALSLMAVILWLKELIEWRRRQRQKSRQGSSVALPAL